MKFFLRKIPAILVMLGIFILSGLPGNDPFLNSFHFNDKIKHIIAYLVLGIAFCMWIPRKRWLEKAFMWGLLIVVICTICGISDEYHQPFVPGRSGNDIGDIMADFTGGLISVFIYFFAVKITTLWRVPEP
jgi:VanZ family protein